MQIIPKEEQLDAVAKIRVSSPQSLIDTDFEYGLQPTKWEFINMTNNRPTAFYNPTTPLTNVNAITTTGQVVTIGTSSTPTVSVGQPIYVQGATNSNINGWFLVATTASNLITYNLNPGISVTPGSYYDTTKTYIYGGTFYTGAGIPVSTTAGAAFTNSGTTVTGTTTYNHGLSVGNVIYVVGTTATTNAPNGTWIVSAIPTANTFQFTVNTAPTGTITAAGATTSLYNTPNGFTVHRPYDGGVQFSAGSGSPNAQIIRQTRRYFRYQSGKALQMSTGSIMCNAMYVDTITSSGIVGTLSTKFPHNMTVGSFIKITGCDQAQYNGVFQVQSIPSITSLTFNTNGVPTATTATGFPIFASSYTWYGMSHRVGIFDTQNGLFFEYDGQTLYAVRRQSTQQISGTLAVTSGSNVVTGTGTFFANQLSPNSYIVIRGQTYRVTSISSQTSLTIAPEYRAATASSLVGSLTIETRFPQSKWNIDPCDGTGPSGYKLDITKNQMWYIDYSWYGAGFIRYGVRTTNGTVTYCHKVPNNNVYTEAWMRSGNLPAHYESFAIQPITTITASVGAADTTINVASTFNFPPSGYIKVTAPGNTGAVEYITYTGITSTSFTGCGRATGYGTNGSAFTFSATAPVSVELAAALNGTPNTTFGQGCPAGSMSHWGTSVVMDGGFNNDLLFSFTGGLSTALAVAGGATNAIISLRLGPSVDTGLTGVLGAREIINRMQLKLQTLRILSTGVFQISVYLNGQPASGTFAPVGGSSLSQIAYHASATTFSGGESIYSFYTNNAGGTANSTLTEEDLTNVRDLGNAILGGGINNTVPTTPNGVYPDGPDIVTIVATNLTGTSANITALVAWTEAQA